MHLRIGTRASNLALKQTEIFISILKQYHNFTFDIVKITTSGDKITNMPLYDIGGKALFLKELEEALESKHIDLAVHSLKDVPGLLSPQFAIAAVLERIEARDCLLSSVATKIEDLPAGARIGTSSPRRAVFIKKINPLLEILPLRGNINTRIQKLKNKEYEAIVLAEAGLKRLDLWEKDLCHPLMVNEMIPAVGQGVIAIEILAERKDLREFLQVANHSATERMIKIERDFLGELNASCKTPIAGFAQYKNAEEIEVNFMLANESQNKVIIKSYTSHISNIEKLGKEAANDLFTLVSS